jgi:polygalacturonase
MMKKYLLLSTACLIPFFSSALYAAGAMAGDQATVDVYPAAPNAQKSEMFAVTVDGKEANVMDYMDYHYVHIGFDGSVALTVTAGEDIGSCRISPLSLGIEAEVNGRQATFNLSQATSGDETPRYLVVQINSLEKLVILGDRPEKDAPTEHTAGIYNVAAAPYSADPTGAVFAQTAIQQAIDDAFDAGGGLVFVPQGLYTIKENLSVKSNVTLYLAPGAALKALDDRSLYEQTAALPPAVIVHHAQNAKITGRGEIDASGYRIMSPPAGFTSQSVQHPRRRVVQLDYSSDVVLDGIIVKDATGWTVELMRSENLTVQNVKVLNHKDVRYKIENDGINAVSSSDTQVNQCFVMTIDDAFCSKARYGDMNNCVFSNNVCYNWSGGVKAGMQSVGDMSNIVFRNCDVIHCRRGVGVDTREGTNAITNVEFRDIRVEETEQTISGGNYAVECESKLAIIAGIKIIRLTCLDNNRIRFFGEYAINDILFEDLRIKGEIITGGSQVNILKGSNTTVGYRFTVSRPVEPVEYLPVMINPGFEYRSEGVLNDGSTVYGVPYGWQDTGGIIGTSFGINKDACNLEGNSACWYNSNPMPAAFELSQTIAGLPAGEYTVRCKLAVDNGKITTQRLFANNVVQYYGYESNYGNNLNEAETRSFAGWNASTATPLDLREMKVNVAIADGETLKTGIRTGNVKADGTSATNNAGWFKVDDFRLQRKKADNESAIDRTAVHAFRLTGERGACRIVFNRPPTGAAVRIVSLSGNTLYRATVETTETKIPLPQGLYIVAVDLDEKREYDKIIVR